MTTPTTSRLDGPTMLGRGDPSMSRWTGEFIDRDLETRFRLWRYDATLLNYKIVAWLVFIAVFPFMWAAYQVLGISEQLLLVTGIRAVLLGLTIHALILAHTRAPHQRLDRGIFAMGAFVLVNNVALLLIMPEVGNMAIVQCLMVLAVAYMILPARLYLLTPALLIFSAAFLAIVFVKSTATPVSTPAMLVWTAIVNVAGWLAARQFNRFRRTEYHAIESAERHAAELDLAHREALAAKVEAERANAAKSAMLANTSHELRTPLNAIIGFSDLMRRQMLGPMQNDRYRDYADDIYRSGEHLLSLIDDLLDLSKIEAGKTEMRPEWLDVATFFEEAQGLVAAQASARRITVSVSIAVPDTKVKFDPRALRQVLVNLLTNAVKFSDEGGYVALCLSSAVHGGVRISVLDSGPGFDDAETERLLQPFQQAGADASTPREGWGLGLALVVKLAELNRSSFSLANRSEGGAMAELTIPGSQVRVAETERQFAESA